MPPVSPPRLPPPSFKNLFMWLNRIFFHGFEQKTEIYIRAAQRSRRRKCVSCDRSKWGKAWGAGGPPLPPFPSAAQVPARHALLRPRARLSRQWPLPSASPRPMGSASRQFRRLAAPGRVVWKQQQLARSERFRVLSTSVASQAAAAAALRRQGESSPPLPSPPPSAASLSQPDLGRGWRGGWGESWCCWCCWRQTRRLSRAIRNRVPWLGMGWCRSSVLPSFSSAAWGESWARDVVADLPREVGSGRQAEACCLHEAGSEPGSAFSRLRSQDLGKPIECHLPPLGKDGLPGCLSAPVCVWAPACSVGWAPGTGTGMCLQGWGS